MLVLKICLISKQHLVRYSYKKTKVLEVVLNQNRYVVLLFLHCILLFLHRIKLYRCKMGIKFDKEHLAIKNYKMLMLFTIKILDKKVQLTILHLKFLLWCN